MDRFPTPFLDERKRLDRRDHRLGTRAHRLPRIASLGDIRGLHELAHAALDPGDQVHRLGRIFDAHRVGRGPGPDPEINATGELDVVADRAQGLRPGRLTSNDLSRVPARPFIERGDRNNSVRTDVLGLELRAAFVIPDQRVVRPFDQDGSSRLQEWN